MAVARFKAGNLDSITYTLTSGYQDDGSYASHTEVASVPVFVTSIIAKPQALQSDFRYIQLFDAANISDVTLGTTRANVILRYGTPGQSGLGVTTVAGVTGKKIWKAVFPDGGLVFTLGCKIAQTTTSTGNTTTAGTTLADEVLVFFRPAKLTY